MTTIQRMGWSSPVGRALFVQRTEHDDDILWTRWSAECIELERAAYMLLLQGMAVQQLFDESCWMDGPLVSTGPFYYLRGDARSIYTAQPFITGVVLAQVLEAPKMPQQELLSRLLQKVLKS